MHTHERTRTHERIHIHTNTYTLRITHTNAHTIDRNNGLVSFIQHIRAKFNTSGKIIALFEFFM